MPSIKRDGATLNFGEQGNGEPVVLQHALTADGRAWSWIGVVEALVAADFRVITIDALGHGKSDASIGIRVGLQERVQDIVAVVEALGIERFHFVGYSMGGWIGTGLARYEPKRLLSLGIAGWDPIDGARLFTKTKDMAGRRVEFVKTIAELAAALQVSLAPDEDRIKGFVDTYARLYVELPSIVSLVDNDFPIQLAVGSADPYQPAVAAAAEALAVDYLALPGDHVAAFQSTEYRQGLVDWLVKARLQSQP